MIFLPDVSCALVEEARVLSDDGDAGDFLEGRDHLRGVECGLGNAAPHVLLGDYVCREEVGMGIDVGGFVSRPVGEGADNCGAGDRNRSGVDQALGFTGRSAVQGVADLGVFGGGGDLKLEGSVKEAPIDTELCVCNKATKGLAVKAPRGWGSQVARTADRGIGDAHGMELRGDEHVGTPEAIVQALNGEHIASVLQELCEGSEIKTREGGCVPIGMIGGGLGIVGERSQGRGIFILDMGAVEEADKAVVVFHAQAQFCDGGNIAQLKG